MAAERVVVVIPTRRRPDHLRRCLSSVRDGDGGSTPIIVVDQDPEQSAKSVCAEFASVKYVSHAAGGKSAALNAGNAASESGFLAFTDDDCTVPEGWIERGLEGFGGGENIAVVFGGAVACEHDPATEFVPAYTPPRREVRRGRRAAAKIGALGGNMFARREALDAVGGWDERLGPGTDLPSGEDQDLNNRLLRAGYGILADPSLLVTHRGARAYADGEVTRLVRGYSRGIGALAMKDIRSGKLAGAYPIVREVAAEVRAGVKRLARRQAEPFILRSPWLFVGMWQGLRLKIDRKTGRFVTRPA